MRCFTDDKPCTCCLDEVSMGDCPRDPFRDMPDDDEDHEVLSYLNGLSNDKIRAD